MSFQPAPATFGEPLATSALALRSATRPAVESGVRPSFCHATPKKEITSTGKSTLQADSTSSERGQTSTRGINARRPLGRYQARTSGREGATLNEPGFRLQSVDPTESPSSQTQMLLQVRSRYSPDLFSLPSEVRPCRWAIALPSCTFRAASPPKGVK